LYHEHVIGSKIGNVSDLDVILKKAREPITIIEKGRRTDIFREKHVLFEEFDCMHSYLQEKTIVICDVMCIHLVAFYRDINRVSRYVKEHSTVLLEKGQTLLKWASKEDITDHFNANATHGCASWKACNGGETCPSNSQATCPDAKNFHDVDIKLGGSPTSFSKVEITGFLFEYIKELKKMNSVDQLSESPEKSVEYLGQDVKGQHVWKVNMYVVKYE